MKLGMKPVYETRVWNLLRNLLWSRTSPTRYETGYETRYETRYGTGNETGYTSGHDVLEPGCGTRMLSPCEHG